MSHRILVVDDDHDVSTLAQRVLGRAGYAVEIADRGAKALQQIARESYDLILLDINMPGMDGWEVLRILKADPQTAGLPVAMFSVRGEVRDKVHGMQDGALDYITKPFGVDELPRRVAAILERPRAGVAGGR